MLTMQTIAPPIAAYMPPPDAPPCFDGAGLDYTHYFLLNDREKHELKVAMDAIPYDDAGACDYIAAVRSAAIEALPRRIRTALEAQRASLNPRPYIVIDNLPTDDAVFGSPIDHEPGRQHKTGDISENLAIAVATMIGEPYSVKFEGADIVNNLVPEKGHEREFTGLGSAVELDFHIENAALKFHSDFNMTPIGLVLTGVRHDPTAPMTRLADARAALDLLSGEDHQILRGKNFRIRVPYRWRDAFGANGSIETDPVPLLSGDQQLPEVHAVFYPDMVAATTRQAEGVIKRFHDAIRAVSFGVDVRPGMLVYVDNRFTMHSRDSFVAQYDDNGRPLRWLQRVFVAANLWAHRGLQMAKGKGRVFEPRCYHA